MLMQIAAIAFVLVDVPVDNLVADLQNTFQFEPLGHLLRTQIQPCQQLHFTPLIRGKLWAIQAGLPALIP